jgi:anti-anti-sigma regulatory factor
MADAGMVEQLQVGDHVCAFVDGIDERLDLMARSVNAGLDSGDKVMIFTEALLPSAVYAGLEARRVAAQPALRAGRVQVLPAREAYLPAGWFDPPRMLGSLAEHIDRAAAEGHRGLRLIGDMAWALDEPAGSDQLAGYEAEVNHLYLDGQALGICLYDRHAFDTDLLRQVACAHPTTSTADTGGEPGWQVLLRMRRTNDPYGLRLIGETDLSNRQALAAALDAVLAQLPDSAAPIVIDVTGLRFADAATAALLGKLTLQAPAGVHLIGCHGSVEAILDRLGVTQLSRMHVTRAAGAGSVGTEMIA